MYSYVFKRDLVRSFLYKLTLIQLEFFIFIVLTIACLLVHNMFKMSIDLSPSIRNNV